MQTGPCCLQCWDNCLPSCQLSSGSQFGLQNGADGSGSPRLYIENCKAVVAMYSNFGPRNSTSHTSFGPRHSTPHTSFGPRRSTPHKYASETTPHTNLGPRHSTPHTTFGPREHTTHHFRPKTWHTTHHFRSETRHTTHHFRSDTQHTTQPVSVRDTAHHTAVSVRNTAQHTPVSARDSTPHTSFGPRHSTPINSFLHNAMIPYSFPTPKNGCFESINHLIKPRSPVHQVSSRTTAPSPPDHTKHKNASLSLHTRMSHQQ
jgi:hypothetical protein